MKAQGYKFTDAKIRSLLPRQHKYDVLEIYRNGFAVTIFPSGKRSWVYLYKYRGRSRRMTLGPYPMITLAEAHDLHLDAFKLSRQGQDPGYKKSEHEAKERTAPLFRDVAAEYLVRAKKKKKTWKDDERILNKDVLPFWGFKKAQTITRRDVLKILDPIIERGAEVSANRCLVLISTVFNFALGRDLVAKNPAISVERPGKEQARDRVLAQEEIKSFWNNLDLCPMAEATRLALKLLLVLAQRRGETSQAKWGNFDFSTNWWTIPSEDTKNGLSHRVYLPPTALTLLSKIKELSGESEYLFPSPRFNGRNPIKAEALSQAIAKHLPIYKVEQFTPHDLRRTASSHMTGNGIPRDTVRKILNHAEPGITAIYDRYSYDKEKANAMIKWGTILQRFLSGQVGTIHSIAG